MLSVLIMDYFQSSFCNDIYSLMCIAEYSELDFVYLITKKYPYDAVKNVEY